MMGEIHLLPGTTFANVAERGNYDPERHAALTLSELERWLAIQIVGPYHSDIHAGLGMPPTAAWAQSVDRRPIPARVPPDLNGFLVDLLPCQERMVRRDGIRLFNIHYWDDVLSVWAGRVETRLPVRFDPRDLSCIWLEAPDGTRWPIRYRDLARPPITLWEHKEAQRRLREQGRGAVDEQLIFDAVEAQRALVAEAVAQTKRARRAVQRVAHLAAADSTARSSQPVLDDLAPTRPDPTSNDSSDPAPPPLLPYVVEDWS
ncbi:Mu transposase C-terminal domain-containing protein [Azospirillum sp. TSO22-1]|uniref:Mu transposase C-terminal domain-containing protein n=1 Tax=Azospirillum sp. TSO22-1 TaxID=716789 RepID=UPI0018EE87B5|nr:Mu transposase C-terminal domain-containing protein [Azospirillum sp. TSO22-1]